MSANFGRCVASLTAPIPLSSTLVMGGCIHALAGFHKKEAERQKGPSAGVVWSLQHSSNSCQLMIHLQGFKHGDVMERHAAVTSSCCAVCLMEECCQRMYL